MKNSPRYPRTGIFPPNEAGPPALLPVGCTRVRNPQEDNGIFNSLRSRQLQDRACQTAVGRSQLIQDREVVCVYDRNQVTREMSLSPVSMEIPTASDHRRQLTRAISYGEWLLGARQAHWRKGFDLDFGQLDLIVDVGGVPQRSEVKYARNRQPCRHSWMIQ